MTEKEKKLNELNELKKLNIEYEKAGYMAPFVFINEKPCLSKHGYYPIYNKSGIQRLKNLSGQSGETNE